MAKAKFNAKVAVGVKLTRQDGKFLVIKKKSTQEWGMPGGKLEICESLTEAAIRETQEETGINVTIGRMLGCFSSKKSGIFVVFDATPIGNTDNIVLEKIHDEYRWIYYDELDSLGKIRPRLRRLYESGKTSGVYEVRIHED